MGVCASKGESDTNAAGGAGQADADPQDREDFRAILQKVTCIILEKLCVVLEFEKEAYDDLRKERNLANYLELMNPEPWTDLINKFIDFSAPAEVDVEENHASYETRKFKALVSAAKEGKIKADVADVMLVNKFQKAVTLSQKELKESSTAADSSDLKIHLNFFHNCLDFVKGDILCNPSLLEANIDQILSSDL